MGVRLQFMVHHNRVQNIHQLTLILMDALCLHVKEGCFIECVVMTNDLSSGITNRIFMSDVPNESALVVLFDLPKLFLAFGITCEFGKLNNPLKIDNPLSADSFGDECRKTGIDIVQPAALGHAVCDIDELFGKHLIKIWKHSMS